MISYWKFLHWTQDPGWWTRPAIAGKASASTVFKAAVYGEGDNQKPKEVRKETYSSFAY